MDTIEADEVDVSDVLGSAIERREDPALITGEGTYTDDIQDPEMAHMAVLRSQYGHAEIESIDTSEAEAMDGVIAVYTAEDIEETGTPGDLPVGWLLPNLKTPSHPILAKDRVRYQEMALLSSLPRSAMLHRTRSIGSTSNTTVSTRLSTPKLRSMKVHHRFTNGRIATSNRTKRSTGRSVTATRPMRRSRTRHTLFRSILKTSG
ncbi:hypothetical protein ACFQJ8_09705 [Halocatena marina]|uniref:hypothetical protein n=1 Tax=Halocatena marina TaxID=2934937 RepID=UPI0036183743